MSPAGRAPAPMPPRRRRAAAGPPAAASTAPPAAADGFVTLSPTLRALLDAGAAHHPEYGDGLSSHRPMALLALARLGADDARLLAFDAAYSPRLPPAPPATAWPAGEPWADALGRPEAWPAARDLFWHWLASEDAASVLDQVLPRLMTGCAGVAFHGLIRTAYAMHSRHHQELADALAYWACRWMPLGEATLRLHQPPAAPAIDDPETLLRLMPRHASRAPLIALRLAQAAALPGFADAVARLVPTPATLPRLARLAAQAYAASGNFTALHLLTASHALQVLLPQVQEPLPLVRHFAAAFAAGVSAAGLVLRPPAPPLSWPQIHRRALASDDEHVIKLVDSATELQRLWPDPVWQQAAARAVAAAEPA